MGIVGRLAAAGLAAAVGVALSRSHRLVSTVSHGKDGYALDLA